VYTCSFLFSLISAVSPPSKMFSSSDSPSLVAGETALEVSRRHGDVCIARLRRRLFRRVEREVTERNNGVGGLSTFHSKAKSGLLLGIGVNEVVRRFWRAIEKGTDMARWAILRRLGGLRNTRGPSHEPVLHSPCFKKRVVAKKRSWRDEAYVDLFAPSSEDESDAEEKPAFEEPSVENTRGTRRVRRLWASALNRIEARRHYRTGGPVVCVVGWVPRSGLVASRRQIRFSFSFC